ncbi:FHA domain-containing protein [Pseudonocardia acaciae]|uniref:FHA domain-containing protein n=1 Tax=Pseudonocardia acaciae TaxID=551276 RepID=UPI00048AACAA|nr:FHA domain-containing protein [Pseudonocardia acaciae]
MTVSCDAGHPSESEDYCDVCGRPIQASPAVPAAPEPAAEPAANCAHCGAPRDGRFCEACGHDATAPVPPPEPVDDGGPYFAVVRADRSWYEHVKSRNGPDVDTVAFPEYCPDRRFALTGQRLAIGRRSRTRGTAPDIDLSGPPTDPGVSAQQALLIARPDGGWDIVDLDSTNGTAVGDSPEPIPPGVRVPLSDGDRIRLGAWTTITITTSPG